MFKSYSLVIALLTSTTDHTDTVPKISRQPIEAIPLAALEINTRFMMDAA